MFDKLSNRQSTAFALIMFILVALALRWPYFGDPAPDFDEQLYHFIGSHIWNGYIPYVDLWDRKPIGLFAIFAFASVLSNGSVWGYQILAFVFALAGAAITYLLGIRYCDRLSAITGGIFYLLIFPNFYGSVGQSEVFYIPLILLMVLLCTKAVSATTRSKFELIATLSMVFGAISLQVKYTTILSCIACGIILVVFHYKKFKDLRRSLIIFLIFAFIGILPTAIISFYFYKIGFFDKYFFANFVSIFERDRPHGMIVSHWSEVIIVKSTLVFSAAAISSAYFHKYGHDKRITFIIIAIYAASGILSFFMLGSSYIYYFISTAAAVNLVALPAYSIGLPGRILSGLVLIVAIFFARPIEAWDATGMNRQAITKLGDAVRPFVSQTHCLWVYDGPMALYNEVDTCIPTRFIYPDHLNNALEKNALGTRQIDEVRRILSKKPGAIITAPKLLQVEVNPPVVAAVKSYLTANCKLVRAERLPHRLVSAYRCRTGTDASFPQAKTSTSNLQ